MWLKECDYLADIVLNYSHLQLGGIHIVDHTEYQKQTLHTKHKTQRMFYGLNCMVYYYYI